MAGKPFHLFRNVCGISKRKFCLNGKRPVVLLIVFAKLVPHKAPKTIKAVFTSDGVGVVSGSRSESAYDLA